jgi:glutathione S-transferase
LQVNIRPEEFLKLNRNGKVPVLLDEGAVLY